VFCRFCDLDLRSTPAVEIGVRVIQSARDTDCFGGCDAVVM
jgi:hypothetical protein